MRKVFAILLVLCFFVPQAFCEDVLQDTVSVHTRDKAIMYPGWHIHGSDDDIDATAELITELDTTYVQMALEDQIEVLSSYNADTTQTVTVFGIDDSGNRISEEFELSGNTATLSSATFRYIEQAYVKSEPVGTITIQTEADTFITSIPIGGLESTMLQRFTGDKIMYVAGWWASVTTTTGNVTFQLRWYPDDDDCLSPAVGYSVLDTLYIDGAVTSPYNPGPHVFAQPIKLPSGGWLAVYGTGSTANTDGSVSVQGFDF